MIDGIYCPDCASDNVILFPRAGEGAYRCLDCGCIFYDPIILNVVAPIIEES